MSKKSVLVLGGTGMLGSMLVDYLSRESSWEIFATVRSTIGLERLAERIPNVSWTILDAENFVSGDKFPVPRSIDWVINAIGVIKPHIQEDVPSSVARAIRVNSLFPHTVAETAQTMRARVLQIATDCVYSGKTGGYKENDPHDPLDVYGKTKSLGEAHFPNLFHLRCSIIGPEPSGRDSLMEWFLGQPEGAKVTGYVNHRWNGVTTLHFAKICSGIMKDDRELPHCLHLVPKGDITKAEMLIAVSKIFRREDITIERGNAPVVVDRTLDTSHAELSRTLWRSAGYSEPPTIPEMIGEMGAYPFRLREGS